MALKSKIIIRSAWNVLVLDHDSKVSGPERTCLSA